MGDNKEQISETTFHLKRIPTDPLRRESTNSSPLIKLSKKDSDNVWFCCRKGRTDARLIQYIATITFSFIILMFSIVQMVRLPPGEGQNTYISLITLVFGIFIPRPKVSTK